MRIPKETDLQSAAFDLSATYPVNDVKIYLIDSYAMVRLPILFENL